MVWWEAFLAYVGGPAAILFVLSFPAKSLIKHWFDKDVESFKVALKADAAAQTEKLRHDLQIDAIEHSVRFSGLHADRAERVRELFDAFVTARSLIYAVVQPSMAIRVEREVDFDRLFLDATLAASKLHYLLVHSKIYFVDSDFLAMTKAMELIRASLLKVQSAIEKGKRHGDPPAAFPEFAEALSDIDSEYTTAAETDLARVFRELLGVQKKNGPPGAS